MVQVLENLDFILHADTLCVIKLELVNDFDSSLLLIRLHCGLDTDFLILLYLVIDLLKARDCPFVEHVPIVLH